MLEFYVTQMVRDFLSDKENAEIAVRDTLRNITTSGRERGNIKSLETRIAKAHKDIEENDNGVYQAKKRIVLRESIEKRMTSTKLLIKV